MAEKVGGIYYDVSLDTSKLIDGQRKVDAELKRTGASVDGFSGKLTAAAAAVGLLSAAMAAVKLAKMADEIRLMGARVEIAAGSVQAGTAAFAALVEISRRTQSSLAGNVEVFNRLNQSILGMGGSQRDTLQITETLGKAIRVSGAGAIEAKAALLQFGQALGSGKLQGDELKSLSENAPYLMQKIADAMGVPKDSLKQLGAQGKLTSDVIANALAKAAAKIDEDFKKVPPTIESAMQVAQDQAALAAAAFDKLSGSSAILTGASKGVGEVLEQLAKQFEEAAKEAGALDRNGAIQFWAEKTKVALSYVVDAVDGAWRVLSSFGNGVKLVFEDVGNAIGARGAQIAAVAKGDFEAAKLIGDEMKKDAEGRRKAVIEKLDGAVEAKLAGEKMRDAWAQGAKSGELMGPPAPPTKLKPPKGGDDDEARKLKARALAAQAYYEGLVAENKSALDRIDAEEKKALTENEKRMTADKNNAAVYGKAKVEIQKKFSRERGLLEERSLQQIADLNIELTVDQEAKIEAIKAEGFRRAEALERLGDISHEQAERAKTAATFEATIQRSAIYERVAQANAENEIAATLDAITQIDIIRQESIRRAEAAYRAGSISYAQMEAEKARAAIDAQNAIRQQVMSVNPLAQLQREYEQKLAIVQFYETEMAKAGVDGSTFVEEKRTELARQYQQQRMALAEAEFAAQSAGNQFLVDSLNSLASSATSSITGLIEGTMTAQEAMRGLGRVVLNEAVGALVQIGLQYIKNAIMGAAADKAMMATKAANAALYTSAVAAQVSVNSSLAASAAFASTAAIPMIGPGLAPGVAAAAGLAAAALGGPAIASAPLAGARRYGGPVSSNSLYRVNEGGRPEMFTAANGTQYMMPTADGRVTSADKVGGGVEWKIIVNNNAAGAQATASVDSEQRIVQIAVNAVAESFASNSGAPWVQLRAASNVQGRM